MPEKIKAWSMGVLGTFAVVGSVWAGVGILDGRYVVSSDFQQLQKNVDETNIILLKAQIYEARKSLRQEPDNEIIQDYLHSLIAQLCTKKPDDGECTASN